MSEARQIGPDDAILLRHWWHPGVPFDARLVVAMNENHGFGRAPGFAQPIIPIEEILLEVGFGPTRRHALGAYRLGCQRRGQQREPEQRRTT